MSFYRASQRIYVDGDLVSDVSGLIPKRNHGNWETEFIESMKNSEDGIEGVAINHHRIPTRMIWMKAGDEKPLLDFSITNKDESARLHDYFKKINKTSDIYDSETLTKIIINNDTGAELKARIDKMKS